MVHNVIDLHEGVIPAGDHLLLLHLIVEIRDDFRAHSIDKSSAIPLYFPAIVRQGVTTSAAF